MFDVLQRVRYWYDTNPASLPVMVGFAGGVVIGAALIWLVFQHGVDESRLHLWITGCVAGGLTAGVLIYQILIPLGSCWAWFGC